MTVDDPSSDDDSASHSVSSESQPAGFSEGGSRLVPVVPWKIAASAGDRRAAVEPDGGDQAAP